MLARIWRAGHLHVDHRVREGQHGVGVGDGEVAGLDVDPHATGVLECDVGFEATGQEAIGDELLHLSPGLGRDLAAAGDRAPALAGNPFETQGGRHGADHLLLEHRDLGVVDVEDDLGIRIGCHDRQLWLGIDVGLHGRQVGSRQRHVVARRRLPG